MVGELEETMEGAELVSTGGERNHGFCANADGVTDAFGDGSAKAGKPGIGLAMLDTFVFPCANAATIVDPGVAVRFVVWIFPSEPPPAGFVESTEDGLAVICGGAPGNADTAMGSGIEGRNARNAKAGFAGAGGGFLLAPFAPGAFARVIVVPFPVPEAKLEGTAEDGVVN